MKIAIILNGISAKKKFFYSTILPVVKSHFHVDVFETENKDDAYRLASHAVDNDYDLVIAAGGDGTLNQVLNGMLSRDIIRTLPLLTVLPLGSGNDFARSLAITAERDELLQRIKTFRVQTLDIGGIQYTMNTGLKAASYFINVADAGMGPEVVSKMSSKRKVLTAALAYHTAIIQTFFSYRPMKITVRTEAWEWKGKLRTAAIANGRFYGSGLCVAPDAKADDGIFSAFICGDLSVFDFIRYSATLKKSKKVIHKKVTYAAAKDFELTSESACRIEADGELLGFLPATVKIIPGKIRFLC